MPNYKITYEGVFNADNENEAEVYASLNRSELTHVRTKKIIDKDGKPQDLNLEKDFDAFAMIFLTDPKFDKIITENAKVLYVDRNNDSVIYQVELRDTDRWGLIKISNNLLSKENLQQVQEKIEFVEVTKQTLGLVLAKWVKN